LVNGNGDFDDQAHAMGTLTFTGDGQTIGWRMRTNDTWLLNAVASRTGLARRKALRVAPAIGGAMRNAHALSFRASL
jgi:hypothetical protein